MKNDMYDWVVVGGGVAGITISEMLSRLNFKTLLVEKNEKLASETSGYFHEWFHTGSLYTLAPDKLLTTRYLLGAIDDLFMFYSHYKNMNLVPTLKGLSVCDKGWFNDDQILFKYKNRRFNLLWKLIISRSVYLLNEIKSHDWLRKRGGSKYDNKTLSIYNYLNFDLFFKSKNAFYEILSSDLSFNSRILLSDILDQFLKNSGEVSMNNKVLNYSENSGQVVIETTKGKLKAKNIALCCADSISSFTSKKLKISYAPMMILKSKENNISSFVELDIKIKNCINMIKKDKCIGLAGGISLNKKDEIDDYFEYCYREHKKRDKSLELVNRYVGLKKELILSNEDRNYLYHINNLSNCVWSVVLGKFSLSFSCAPEFIRRVYKINPPYYSGKSEKSNKLNTLIDKTMWKKLKESKNYGHDKNSK